MRLPPDDLKRGTLADAMVAGGGKPLTPAEQSAADHPFPEAVSEGLVPPSTVPAEAAKVTHVQVAATLGYDAEAAAASPPVPAPAAAVPAAAPALKPAAHTGGPLGAIGRFFKRLFAR